MPPIEPGLIRKTRSSCIALATTGALLSATFFGCSPQSARSEAEGIGARSEIFTGYLSHTGDQAYQVDAPDQTLQQHGIAKYGVQIVNKAIHVASLDRSGQQIASLEMNPTDAGIQFVTRDGAERHVYVLRTTGSVDTKDFNLHLTYDGHEFTAGYNARGQFVTTGDMAFAPRPASPRMQQMWRDVLPNGRTATVVSEQAMSQCFACFLCGAGAVALAAAVAGVIWLGWAVLGPIITAVFTKGTAAAIALLQKAGVAVALATAVAGAVAALGWGVVSVCYKCITGNDLFTASDTCTPPPSEYGAGFDSVSDTEIGDGGGDGSGSGSGSDTCSCPVDTNIAPDLAKVLIPAFN
jgi:hypothetical protein